MQLASVRMNAEMFQQMSQLCIILYFCCFQILCAFNSTLVLPEEKSFVCMLGVHPHGARQLCPSIACFTRAAWSSVAPVVIHMQLIRTAQSLDLKFPTAGTKLIAFASVFQGPLTTVKKTLLLLFSNRT